LRRNGCGKTERDGGALLLDNAQCFRKKKIVCISEATSYE
jgi:hypothetical protein